MLVPILADLPVFEDSRVLVGFRGADDAGVYLINEEIALVQTIDFFTPVVDDPGVYGEIAAANALSDVYAMGATPIFALSVVGFPSGTLEDSILAEILRGGTRKMNEARTPVIGGHSVQDPEIKFGYCVTGTVSPDRIWTNSGARPGDLLYLSKPLGIGIITTGVKYGKTPEPVAKAAIESMLELNAHVASTVSDLPVHAATDVTGYGLVGHAYEVASGSDVTLEISVGSVPVLAGARHLARRRLLPGGIFTNRAYAGEAVDWRGVEELDEWLLLDPQTSGGLLLSLPPEAGAEAKRRLGSRLAEIGRVLSRETSLIRFIPG